MFIDVLSVHSDWYYPFNYEQARMTSLVLGIEQIVGLVQILDEHKQPVSVVAKARMCKRLSSPGMDPPAYIAWARICKRLRSPGMDSASLYSLSPNL